MSFDKDALKENIKGLVKPTLNPKDSIKSAANIDPGNIFRTGRTAALKTQEKQSLLIERQRQQEDLRLQEVQSEIKSKQAFAKSGRAGRRSLISTSETGVTTLGGG